jgi:alkylresorcinol/alkylpyrone synthase
MPRIVSAATAFPSFALEPPQVKEELRRLIDPSPFLDTLLRIVDNSGVQYRHTIAPLDHIIKERSLEQQCREYARGALELGRRATEAALERAGIKASEVDLLISVSCTGFMIPSLDAYLINELGFRPNCRRLPITELGCAGGASAVARAADFLRGRKQGIALVVAVELSSLTFQSKDITLPAMISAILFGDGAAALVLRHDETATPGAEILDTTSYLFPNTTRAMGFDLKTTGFHIVLRKDVPDIIRERLHDFLQELTQPQGITPRDISFYALHPGGRKILEYMQERLELPREALGASWEVLRSRGNLSSASVLAVYEEELRQHPPKHGDYGLMAAFGPGFSAEFLLLRWTDGTHAL